MMWIGITGPMGSGKSTVAHLLRQMGFDVLDADAVARKVLSPGSPGEVEVLQTFGQQLKDRSGHLDRRALGRLVFGDVAKLAQLEKIIHPLVRTEVSEHRQRLEARGCAAAFYDVPLLFEKNMVAQFDQILVVSAAEPLRYARLQTRSQLSVDEIAERVRHHLPAAMKEAAASAVIQNNFGLDELKIEVDEALRLLKISKPKT